MSDSAFSQKLSLEKQKLISAGSTQPKFKVTDSLDGAGDYSRIANVLRKAKRGEPVTIGILGDSIGSGAGASPLASNSYAALVRNWWGNVFGYENVNLVNASIGSNSLTNIAHRMDDDLLRHNPDLVIFQGWQFHNATDDSIAMESIIKGLLDKDIAVVFLLLTASNGQNNRNLLAPVARHYQTPVVSFARAFAESGLAWSVVGGDSIHPNNTGHALIALCVNTLMTQIGETLNTIGSAPVALPALPYQENGRRYVGATLWDREDTGKFTVESAGSFTAYEKTMTAFRTYKGWQSGGTQNPLVCKLQRISTLHLMFCYFDGGGTAHVTVTTQSGRVLCSDLAVNTIGASAAGYSWNSQLLGADINEPVTVSIRAVGSVRVLGFMVTVN